MCEEEIEGRVGEMDDGWMGSGAMGAAEEDASPDMVVLCFIEVDGDIIGFSGAQNSLRDWKIMF